MEKFAKPLIAFCTLVGMIVGGLAYFATDEELDAVAASVQQNTEELNYQSALRQYEFLLKKSLEYPEDQELARKLAESSKRVRFYECRLFDQGCE